MEDLKKRLSSMTIPEIKKTTYYKDLSNKSKYKKKAELIDAIILKQMNPDTGYDLKSVLMKMKIKDIKDTMEFQSLPDNKKKLRKKQDIVNALIQFHGKNATHDISKPKKLKTKEWKDECKSWEENCPNATTLLGDDWCEEKKENVVRDGEYKFCFHINEIAEIIHNSFTSLDSSYQVPPLRLIIPVDPYRREWIPIILYEELFKRMSDDSLKKYPEIFYLKHHFKEFLQNVYNDPNTKTLSKAKLSKLISDFLHKHKHPFGGIKYKRISNSHIKWKFRRTH